MIHSFFLPILVFTSSLGTITKAQELHAAKEYADAPASRIISMQPVSKVPEQLPPMPNKAHAIKTAIPVLTLIAGEAVDSWGTYRNMTHSGWICGNSAAFSGGYDTNVPAKIASLRDVERVCGTGPAGQTANWAFDVTQNRYFCEGGWVTQLHLAGRRNYAAVEVLNLANDIGWYLIARHLGRRSDWLRKVGPALTFGRGIVHLYLGLDNLTYVAHHRDPNRLNLYLPVGSNFTSPRWWGTPQ